MGRDDSQKFQPARGKPDAIYVTAQPGTVSIDAMRWLGRTNTQLTILDWDGSIISQTCGSMLKDPGIRRAQYQAQNAPIAEQIATDLVHEKIERQKQTLEYLLNVIEHNGPSRVELRNKTTIDLYMPKGSDAAKRERVMLAWYRKELKTLIPPMIEKWENIIGVKVSYWGVKKMKTKWGSCNSEAGRIWLNFELVKKPVHFLEYIIVHEITHLLEKHHNDDFMALMDRFMPKWRLYRDELNSIPLCHETWSY